MKSTTYIFIYSLLAVAVAVLSAAPADSLVHPDPNAASPDTSNTVDTLEVQGKIRQTGNCMQYDMPILGKGKTLSENIKKIPLQENLEYNTPLVEPSVPPCEENNQKRIFKHYIPLKESRLESSG